MKLLDYCFINHKKVLSYEGKKKYVATGDVEENKIINFTNYEYEKKPSRADLIIDKDDVLFAKMMATKKVLIGDEKNIDYIYSTGFYCLRAKENVRPKLLYYYLNSIIFNQKKDYHCSGATMKAINDKGLLNIDVNFPNIDIQDKIISELDTITLAIKNKEEAVRELDNLINSYFYELFGDINNNEKCWELDYLKNKIKIIGGYAFKSQNFSKIGIPVLKIGNINSGYTKLKDLVFWEEDNMLKKYLVFPGDILMSLTGTVGKDDYGNICIIDDSYSKYYLNQRNAKLQIVDNSINKYYLIYALKNPQIKKKLTNISRGVRQANISNKDIENLALPIPSIELQEKFENKVVQINNLKQQYQKDIKDLNQLLDIKMNDYFN